MFSPMKKKNGHNWEDFNVDTLIAIQGKMDVEFSKSKNQGMFLDFL
jgi:hypothetical protein